MTSIFCMQPLFSPQKGKNFPHLSLDSKQCSFAIFCSKYQLQFKYFERVKSFNLKRTPGYLAEWAQVLVIINDEHVAISCACQFECCCKLSDIPRTIHWPLSAARGFSKSLWWVVIFQIRQRNEWIHSSWQRSLCVIHMMEKYNTNIR